MKKCIVIKGNIKQHKNSNKTSIKNDVKKLKTVLSDINTRYKEFIISDFTCDEKGNIEGTLNKGTKAMHIVLSIQEGMLPDKLRFGIGIGPFENELHSSGIALADSALKYAEEIENKKNHIKTNIIVRCDSNILCSVFDSLSACLYSIYSDWSKNQHAIIIHMLMENTKQKELAKLFGSSQPAVNKSIIAGSGHTFIESVNTTNKLIEKIRK